MCATLIGGMDRLKREYIDTARKSGVDLKVFTGKENRISGQMGSTDLVIVFTNKVSHSARKEVMQYARSRSIPVAMIHSCGISTLRQCLSNHSR
ncbi:hypothetical protein Dde_0283 [Oleidesulfovibrio alaskensis G20]|jgi:hypothetical protein|uniref:DUF2325 domain-containing protein n=1 Tax=Oleidesulfovibrio alaskensis (strain ATCC BAA-1058 / DSM 17464 / G20) TaxID=207559 RepID=Q316R2_OLEA2|nr:DUF2325 domain-containing protein [Oleidesulfovibrio alaskensis]ABB37084.1 hypothetical protein Dde_0283 [Oleidesulfovibrio alaskensis G20]MBG0772975.1 DUF2325 domain-containing protein [Oleidesulfovibrio alaskensis]MBL3582893.1 DUF2325 domain-containing protein [Oleidesulfovibrio alaskensis]